MQSLTREQFADQAAEFDAMVHRTSDIDQFCSSTDWVIPADRALMPPREPWLWRGEHSWLALARGENRQGWMLLQALEAAWGLASPVAGADAVAAGIEVAQHLREQHQAWDVALFTGVPLHAPLLQTLVRELTPHYRLRGGNPTRRHVASLRGGLDGFMGRRSRNLRKALRRALRRAEREGIWFEVGHVADPALADAAYGRILAVEQHSWKGEQGVGIEASGMKEFYRLMNRRLVARCAQRLYFARQGERDIGYVLGGVLGRTYRGLQFSYAQSHAEFGIGGLLQYHQIAELCAQGYEEYDLGTDLAYKRRWADGVRETVLLIVGKA